MQTLIPTDRVAAATYATRRGRVLGYRLSPLAVWLFVAGLLLAMPAFFRPHLIWLMVVWDAGVLLLCVLDIILLPSPSAITVERRFLDTPELGTPVEISITVVQRSKRVIRMGVTDSLHPSFTLLPETQRITVRPDVAVHTSVTIRPALRGDIALGNVYLSLRTSAGLCERIAMAPMEQTVRVMPSAIGVSDEELFMLRARQLELERRRLRRIGVGREFEALRTYQPGDEIRSISWTATARRGEPVTRVFTTERSQQVWTVIDAGRLSRTSFEVELRGSRARRDEFRETHDEQRLHLQQVDQAVSAAMLLSRVVDRAGDRSGMLAYGRTVQQQVMPGKGAMHQRRLLDALAMVQADRAEGDHRRAGARLRQLQTRRSLIFWITEMSESVSLPDVALAATALARQHLVVLVLLEHPQLPEFAGKRPESATEMFAATAANEMLARRRAIVSRLHRQGVMIVETSPEKVGISVINQYLEIKSRGSL